MFHFLADVNFNDDILRALARKALPCVIVAARDVGLNRAIDEDLLEWAASRERIVLSHDRQTLAGHALARVEAGLAMLGVGIVNDRAPIARVVDDLQIAISCTQPEEWRNRVLYFPL